MGRALLITTVFLVVALNILTTVYLINTADELSSTARAGTAEASICINAPPTIQVPCNTTIDQGDTFTCQLGVQDQNPGQNHTFSEQWPGTPIFTVSDDGSINYTTDNDDVGTHTVTFFVNDSSGCRNERDNETFTLNVTDVNDAPVLTEDIPDVELVENQTTLAFFLSDHFTDPDGDVLTYTKTIPGSPFSVRFVGGSGVEISADGCEPEEQLIQFTATDPSGLNATSNIVTLKAKCAEDPEPDGSTGGGAGGGSGGGVGAGTCEEEWQCLDWMQCLPTGYQWRHCYDLGGCNDEPKFLKRECNYQGEEPECSENWLCQDWGACQPNGTQYRSCEDLAECGSRIYKPPTEQACEYNPTCNDGIKNGNETGVDCGGDCEECPVIETPGFTEPERFNMWLLFAILTGILLTGGVMRLYHEELAKALSRLELLLSRKKRKEVLLDGEEKRVLLEKIAAAEASVEQHEEWPAERKYGAVAEAGRAFFATLGRLPEGFTKEELEESLKKRKPSKELAAILLGLFDRIYAVEAGGLVYNEAFLYSLSEELRTMVCQLSRYSVHELERPIKEFGISDDMSVLDEMLVRSVRVHRAVQFEQYSFARREYEQLLHSYEDLPVEDQESMYDETRHAFAILRYASERTEA